MDSVNVVVFVLFMASEDLKSMRNDYNEMSKPDEAKRCCVELKNVAKIPIENRLLNAVTLKIKKEGKKKKNRYCRRVACLGKKKIGSLGSPQPSFNESRPVFRTNVL